MSIKMNRIAATAVALTLGLGLGACSTDPAAMNTSLNSVNQPVVERSNFTLDVRASSSGLTVPEQARLTDWFDTLDIGFGDRIAIDDPVASEAVRTDVAAIAGRYGLLLEDGAPVTTGYVDPGNVRVVVTRSTAHVPNCPNWSGRSSSSLRNATSANYGCSVNSNLAAMIADPEHLLNGAEGTGETIVMSSTKAIESYRDAEPSGAGGLPDISSQEN